MTWIDTTELRRDACRILRDAGWTIDNIAIVIGRPAAYVERRLAPPRESEPYFRRLPPGFADDDPFEPGRWLGNRARRAILQSGASNPAELRERLSELETMKGIGRGTIEEIRRWISADVPKAEP